MQTFLKLLAVAKLDRDFYPIETVARFKKLCTYGRKNEWLEYLQKSIGLQMYIDCLNFKYYGKFEEQQKLYRKRLELYNISRFQHQWFLILNRTFLEDLIEITTDKTLLKYYRMVLCLNDGTVIGPRKKFSDMVNRLEAKIVCEFASAPDRSLEECRNFILVCSLFSDMEYSFDEETIAAFEVLCTKLQRL